RASLVVQRRLMDRAEGRVARTSAGGVVPADHGHVVGDAQVELVRSGERAERELVAHGEQRGGTWGAVQQGECRAAALLAAVDRDLVDVQGRGSAGGAGGGSVAGQPLTGDAVAGAADLGGVAVARATCWAERVGDDGEGPVPELQEVLGGGPGGGAVVHADERDAVQARAAV